MSPVPPLLGHVVHTGAAGLGDPLGEARHPASGLVPGQGTEGPAAGHGGQCATDHWGLGAGVPVLCDCVVSRAPHFTRLTRTRRLQRPDRGRWLATVLRHFTPLELIQRYISTLHTSYDDN